MGISFFIRESASKPIGGSMKIALIQIENHMDVDFNFLRIKKILTNLEKDTKIVFFPECALTGYLSNLGMTSINSNHPVLSQLRDLAIESNLTIFIGANYENTYLYNAYIKINHTVEIYYKTHLGEKERKLFKAGNILYSFDVDDFKFGVAICLESHIPDIIQHYRLDGCHAVVMPFASPSSCGNREVLWNKYLPVRAYDNNLYVFAMNLWGQTGNLFFSGGLVAIDPKGNIISERYEEGEQVIYVNVEKGMVERMHKGQYKCNYVNRRRPELYRKE